MKESYEELQKQLNIKKMQEELGNKKSKLNIDNRYLLEDINKKKKQ